MHFISVNWLDFSSDKNSQCIGYQIIRFKSHHHATVTEFIGVGFNKESRFKPWRNF